jgi:hypothetical protein
MQHLVTAPKLLDNGKLGFPDSKFLADFQAGSVQFDAIRTGHFMIDYFGLLV